MTVLAVIAFAILFAIVGTFAYAGIRAAPWVPTHRADVARFLRLAAITPGMRVVDLGCGNARMLAAAVRAGAVGTGYEISLLPYILAKFRSRSLAYRGRLTVCYRDFWHVSLADADLVYVFLMSNISPRIRRKLERELKPGARVISYVWPLDGWQPVAVDRVDGRQALYLYQIPSLP